MHSCQVHSASIWPVMLNSCVRHQMQVVLKSLQKVLIKYNLHKIHKQSNTFPTYDISSVLFTDLKMIYSILNQFSQIHYNQCTFLTARFAECIFSIKSRAQI